MILSKQSLQAAAMVAAIDKPNLAYFSTGASYAINRKAAVLISPLAEERIRATPLKDSGPCSFGVNVDSLKSILKLIPADKLFKGLLESVEVSVEGATAHWIVTDGRRTHQAKCSIEPFNYALVSSLRGTWRKKWDSALPASISALNAQRVLVLLEALHVSGCSASGEEPVWLRTCADGSILLRAVNYATHQRVLGMCTAYSADEGKMPEWIYWEKGSGPMRKVP